MFEEGTYLPVPSQEAMKKSIGKGGNGVITNIYHKGMEFAAKKVSVRERDSKSIRECMCNCCWENPFGFMQYVCEGVCEDVSGSRVCTRCVVE